jgi:hypothetical protein
MSKFKDMTLLEFRDGIIGGQQEFVKSLKEFISDAGLLDEEDRRQIRENAEKSALLQAFSNDNWSNVIVDIDSERFSNSQLVIGQLKLKSTIQKDWENERFVDVLKKALGILSEEPRSLLSDIFPAQLGQIAKHFSDFSDGFKRVVLYLELYPMLGGPHDNNVSILNFYEASNRIVYLCPYNEKYKPNPDILRVAIHELVHAGDHRTTGKYKFKGQYQYFQSKDLVIDAIKRLIVDQSGSVTEYSIAKTKIVVTVCQGYISTDFARLYRIGNLQNIKPGDTYLDWINGNEHEFLSHYFADFALRMLKQDLTPFLDLAKTRCGDSLLGAVQAQFPEGVTNSNVYATQLAVIKFIQIFSDGYFAELTEFVFGNLKQYLTNEMGALSWCFMQVKQNLLNKIMEEAFDIQVLAIQVNFEGIDLINGENQAILQALERKINEILTKKCQDKLLSFFGKFVYDIFGDDSGVKGTCAAISVTNSVTDELKRLVLNYKEVSLKQQALNLEAILSRNKSDTDALTKISQVTMQLSKIQALLDTVSKNLEEDFDGALDVETELAKLDQDVGMLFSQDFMDLEADHEILPQVTDTMIIDSVSDGNFNQFYKMVIAQFIQIVKESGEIDEDIVRTELFHYINRDIDDEGNSLLHLIANHLSINHSNNYSSMGLFVLMLGGSVNAGNDEGITPSDILGIGGEQFAGAPTNIALASHVEQSISMMKSDAMIPFWVYSWCVLSKSFNSLAGFVSSKCKESGLFSYFSKDDAHKEISCDQANLDTPENAVIDVVFSTMEETQQSWIRLEEVDPETQSWISYLGCNQEIAE